MVYLQHPDDAINAVINDYNQNHSSELEAITNPYKDSIYSGFIDWVKQNYSGSDYDKLISLIQSNPSGSRGGFSYLRDAQAFDKARSNYLMSILNSDNALEISNLISGNINYSLSPEQQQVLNNYVSENMANTANTRQIDARDSSLLSTAGQLQQLGLNMGSVASLGGASAGVAGAMAQADKSNNAQQMRLAKFNEKAQMTRTLIGLLGGMASAGIYGGAIAHAKRAASQLANEASHYATDTKFAMFDNYERVSYKTHDGGYLAYNHYKW